MAKFSKSKEGSMNTKHWYDEIDWKEVGSYWVQEIEVTPELAEAMLGKMSPNRHLRVGARDAYLAEMEANRWVKNGATIVFEEDGCLLDGQHRLRAIANGETSIPLLVVFGVNKIAMASIDTGIVRTAGDIAGLSGYANSRSLSSAARTHLLYKDRLLGRGQHRKVLSSEILSHIQNNPKLGEAASRLAGDQDLRNLIGSAGIVAFFICSEIDSEDAAEFFARLSDGANLSVTSPIYMIRRFLMNNKQRRLSPMEVLETVIVGWNAFRKNKVLKIVRLGTGDRFPAAI